MLAQEGWLGCRHDASLMVDILGSTLVWAQYMYFRLLIQILYLLCFKSLYVLWKDTGGPWHCLGPTTIKECFRPPMMFSLKKWKIHRFIVIVSFKLKLIYIFVLYTACINFMLLYAELIVFLPVKFIVISILHRAHGLLTLLLSHPDPKNRCVAIAACPWMSTSYPKLTQELARHLVP